MSDLHPFRDLYDAAVRHYGVRLTCDHCRRSAVFQVAALWLLFNRNGWNDRLEKVQDRFCCALCWQRRRVKVRPSMTFCEDQPTDTRFPMPTKGEWAHEARRRR